MNEFDESEGLFAAPAAPSTIGSDDPQDDLAACYEPVLHEEYEVKLDLPSADTLRSLSELGSLGAATTFELNAVYFDTPSFDLFSKGSTLRRRSGGADAGWHLKVKSGHGKRREYQAPIVGARPPWSLREVLPEELHLAPLIPVTRMITTRTEIPVLDEAGQTVALISEDHVVTSVRPDVHDPRISKPTGSWTEVEIEHVKGDGKAVQLIERALVSRGARPSPYASKLERALEAWDRPKIADHKTEVPLSAGQVVMAFAATQVGIIQALEQELRVDAFDAVHRVRVATRRLRSTLSSYKPLFEADGGYQRVEILLDELRWYARLLGAARDGEVLKEHLAQTALEAGVDPNSEQFATTMARIERAHASAHSALVEAMHLPQYEVLQDDLSTFLTDPPLGELANLSARDVLPGLIAPTVRPVARMYLRALSTNSGAKAWHEVRKKAKRARYFAESLVPFFAEARKEANRWERVTDELGLAQDSAVSIQTLDEIARESTSSLELLPELRAAERKAAQVHLDEGKKAVRAALASGVVSF